jgi:hypothetical protein
MFVVSGSGHYLSAWCIWHECVNVFYTNSEAYQTWHAIELSLFLLVVGKFHMQWPQSRSWKDRDDIYADLVGKINSVNFILRHFA